MKKPLRQKRPVRAAAGFTLIEVTIASLITLVGLLAVSQLFLFAALHNKSSRQVTTATMLAQRKIEQLLALPITHADLAYNGSLGTGNLPTGGTTENYYVDYNREGHQGTGEISTAPFYTDQPASYTVTWVVLADDVNPPLAELRRIVVRAEATQAAMTGNGLSTSSLQKEFAQLSTIRTPPQ